MYVVGDWVEGNVGNLSFGDCVMIQPGNLTTLRKETMAPKDNTKT